MKLSAQTPCWKLLIGYNNNGYKNTPALSVGVKPFHQIISIIKRSEFSPPCLADLYITRCSVQHTTVSNCAGPLSKKTLSPPSMAKSFLSFHWFESELFPATLPAVLAVCVNAVGREFHIVIHTVE